MRTNAAPVGIGATVEAETLAFALDVALCELIVHAPSKARTMALANSGALIGLYGLESFLARYGVDERNEVLTLKENWFRG